MSDDIHSQDRSRDPHPITRVLRRRSTDRLEPTVSEPYSGIRTRKADIADLVRRRGDGTIDIVELTDEEAVALGLRKPTWRMRLRAWWRSA